jgi:hypothetical protein
MAYFSQYWCLEHIEVRVWLTLGYILSHGYIVEHRSYTKDTRYRLSRKIRLDIELSS